MHMESEHIRYSTDRENGVACARKVIARKRTLAHFFFSSSLLVIVHRSCPVMRFFLSVRQSDWTLNSLASYIAASKTVSKMVHLVVKNVRKKVLEDFWLPIGIILNFVRKITVEPTVLFFSFSGGISMLSVQTMYIDKVSRRNRDGIAKL